jgi:AAA family ATP:ADP antiporter
MRSVFGHLVDVKRGEIERVVASAVFFFCALFGYFLLRPARESLGVENTEEIVKYLYVGTLVVTAVLNPVFGWAVSRFPRRVFVPWTYRFFMVSIALFAVMMMVHPAPADGVEPTAARVWVSRSYYIWVTVFALFNTMVFWALMADTFRLEQSKRVYAPIAVGGTLGALAGGSCAWWLAGKLGTEWVVVGAIAALEVVVWCFFWVDRATKRAEAAGEFRDAPAQREAGRSIGGDAWGGLVRTVRSPYLMGTGGYIVMMSIVSTFFYFAQLEIVRTTGVSSDHRTALFGQIDVWSQVATLMVQLFLTSHMVRRLGVGPTLAALPVIAMVGFGAIALAPGFAVMAVSQAVYRAGRYAFARPARETLFTVLDREDRYKSKAFVDTFLFRGGDVIGAWADGQAKTLAKSMATAGTDATVVALRTCAVAVCGIGVGWTALALWLGRAQRRKVAEGHVGAGEGGVAGATGTAVG